MKSGDPQFMNDQAKPQLRISATIMRHELRRFALSERQRTLASLILSLTWEESLAVVRIPELKFFTLMTGMAASHVSTTLHQLHKLMRVIFITELAGCHMYALNPDTDQWQAMPRTSRSTLLHALNIIRELNGVPLHTEEHINFKIKEAANFIQILATKPVTAPKKETP